MIVLAGVFFAPITGHQVIVHEIEHGNHQSNTHSSPVCAWLCAASQAIDTAAQLDAPCFTAQEVLHSSHSVPPLNVSRSRPFTRGPPSEA